MASKKLHDVRDTTFSNGKVGLEAFNSRVEFKDLLIRSWEAGANA